MVHNNVCHKCSHRNCQLSRRKICALLVLSVVLAWFYLVSKTANKFIYPPKQATTHEVVVPKGYKTIGFGTENWGTLPWFGDKFGDTLHCDRPCMLIPDAQKADGVMFCKSFLNFPEAFMNDPQKHNHSGQLWLVMTVESPASSALYTAISHTKNRLRTVFNLVDSYQPDADLNGIGIYGKTVKLQNQRSEVAGHSKHLSTKTDLVLGMLTNCEGNRNSGRNLYIKTLIPLMLQKGKTIDVFGRCFDGGRCEDKHGKDGCDFRKLGQKYKFFLSFENSLCWGYITEKFWDNALSSDMVPIVNGGLSKEDYTAVAPPNSFIHVDDFASPEDLVDYLIYLDTNDTAYNSYFAWTSAYEVWNNLKTYEPPCPRDPNCTHQRYCTFCDILHGVKPWDLDRRVDTDKVFSTEINCRKPIIPPWASYYEQVKMKTLRSIQLEEWFNFLKYTVVG